MSPSLKSNLYLVENVTRIVALVATIAAFVAALVAQIKFGGFNDAEMVVIRLASLAANQEEPSSNTEATTALVFAVTGVVGVTAIILVLETVFNSKHNSASRKIFTLVYLILVLVCCIVFLTGAVLAIVTSVKYSNLLSDPLPRAVLDGGSITSDVIIIRNSIATISVFSLLATLLYGALGALVIVDCCVIKDNSRYSFII